MVNKQRITDQYCLDKIKSVLNFDLKRLSFSDSNLQYLNLPLNLKVNNNLKLKYLNCFNNSLRVYRFKKQLIDQDKVDQRKSNQIVAKIEAKDQFQSSSIFDIDKIHNYRDYTNLVSSTSSSELSSNLNEPNKMTKLYESNKSNLLIYKQLTQSDPEFYSTNLLSYLDNETKDKQLFFLKIIYSTFKSLNLFKIFRQFKRKVNSKSKAQDKNINVKSNSLNESHLKDDSKNNSKDNCKDISIDNSIVKSLDNSIVKSLDNLKEMPKDKLKNEISPKTHSVKEKLNLDKIISCVDLKRKLIDNEKENKSVKKMNLDASISSLDQDKLSRILTDLASKTSLDKNGKDETNLDVNSLSFKNDVHKKQMKPLKAINDYISPLLKLNLLDNFLTRTLSNTMPFNLRPFKPLKPIKSINEDSKRCKCNCDHNQPNKQLNKQLSAQLNVPSKRNDEIDVIDLNDSNNYKYYKDTIFDSFDLDVKDEEAIKLEFDKKFETFLKEDLKRLDRLYKKESKKDLIDQKKHLRDKENATKEQFDSVKRLNLFQSKIPVLKRDNAKFSKVMLDKLEIKYDPLKVRKKSKELIDALNEDYTQRFEEDNYRSCLEDKLNLKCKLIKNDTESLKSLKIN